MCWVWFVRRLRPLQVLSTRARKDVSAGEIKVQVVLFAFDCLHLNGQSLLHKPLTERREALYSALVEKEGQLQFASAKTSRDVEELEVLHPAQPERRNVFSFFVAAIWVGKVHRHEVEHCCDSGSTVRQSDRFLLSARTELPDRVGGGGHGGAHRQDARGHV